MLLWRLLLRCHRLLCGRLHWRRLTTIESRWRSRQIRNQEIRRWHLEIVHTNRLTAGQHTTVAHVIVQIRMHIGIGWAAVVVVTTVERTQIWQGYVLTHQRCQFFVAIIRTEIVARLVAI